MAQQKTYEIKISSIVNGVSELTVSEWFEIHLHDIINEGNISDYFEINEVKRGR